MNELLKYFDLNFIIEVPSTILHDRYHPAKLED